MKFCSYLFRSIQEFLPGVIGANREGGEKEFFLRLGCRPSIFFTPREQEVEDNPALFGTVFSGLFDDEPVVRMRSADVIEKVLKVNLSYSLDIQQKSF